MVLGPWKGQDHLHAAALLLAAGRRISPVRAWSIAELRLDADDFAKLEKWARWVDGSWLLRELDGTGLDVLPAPGTGLLYRRNVTLGFVLLAYFAECVARGGSVDAVWPAIVARLHGSSLGDALFHARGTPRAELRSALRAAAERLQLRRSIDGEPGEYYWYRLLLLQAGITQPDADRVGVWLHSPETRTFLVGALGEVASFSNAWTALRRLGAGGTQDAALRAVQACPFFRADAARVIAAAKRPVEKGAAAVRSREEVSAPALLSLAHHVRWPVGGQPEMVLEPVLADVDELGACVGLLVDGVHRAVLQRIGGRFRLFGGSGLRLPLARRFTLTARAAIDLEPVTVDLCDEDGAIACFDGDGRPCAPDARSVRFVVAGEPLTTTCPEARAVWMVEARVGIVEVATGLEVHDRDGRRVWPAEPDLAAVEVLAMHLEVREVCAGGDGSISVRIGHASGVRVLRAFMGPNELHVTHAAGDEVLLEGVVPASHAAPEMGVTVRGKLGGRVVQRTVFVRTLTRAALDGAWVDASSAIEADRLRGGALRVALGHEFESCDARLFGVMERNLLTSGARRPLVVHALGYGEPLEVRGQAPWAKGGVARRLAARVEDRGVLVRHMCSAGELRLELRTDLEAASAEHWVLVWPREGVPCAAPIARVEGRAVVVNYDGRRPRAVALCFGEAVLGADWSDDWSHDLAQAGLAADLLVRMVRVFPLPFLASAHASAFASALRALCVASAIHAACERARDAIVPIGDARRVRPARDDDRWPEAVRWVLLELRLSARAQVTALQRAVEATCPRPTFAGGVATHAEQQALTAWRVEHGNAFPNMLLSLGAMHPADAASLLQEPKREAQRLADSALSIDYETVRTDKALAKRLRAAQLRALRDRWPEDVVGPVLEAACAWTDRAASPSARLRESLVDPRMGHRVQVELLSRLCAPQNNPA